MSEYVSPVYNVKAIPVEKIRANNYNPNKVAPPEMKLLEIPFGKTVLHSRSSAIMTRQTTNISLLTAFTALRRC